MEFLITQGAFSLHWNHQEPSVSPRKVEKTYIASLRAFTLPCAIFYFLLRNCYLLPTRTHVLLFLLPPTCTCYHLLPGVRCNTFIPCILMLWILTTGLSIDWPESLQVDVQPTRTIKADLKPEQQLVIPETKKHEKTIDQTKWNRPSEMNLCCISRV